VRLAPAREYACDEALPQRADWYAHHADSTDATEIRMIAHSSRRAFVWSIRRHILVAISRALQRLLASADTKLGLRSGHAERYVALTR